MCYHMTGTGEEKTISSQFLVYTKGDECVPHGNVHDDEVEANVDNGEHAIECGVLDVASKQVDSEYNDARD